ncbi:MAG: hypothetical protein FJW69_02525 [Actinobacteria bacterium]|nr:hypothetical protein [Actinomycetota bacterium]
MIFITILSVILIWLHISSLRFIIKSNADHTIIQEAEKLEEKVPEEERQFSLRSGPGIISLAIVIFLNVIEIGYFIACVYIFNSLIVVIGSAVLAGYTLYSLIKFLPNMKKFYSKPSEYLKEKTSGAENILNFIMTSLEIVFCIYILFKAVMSYGLFGLF